MGPSTPDRQTDDMSAKTLGGALCHITALALAPTMAWRK
jgi:hypothetical protein